MKLDIYVQGKLVGLLEDVDSSRFVFTYGPNVPDDHAVSLLMPVRTESYVSTMLHPIFQVSLPEGALRAALERRLAKQLGRFADMDLLAATGHNTVGRVQAVPHGEGLHAPAQDPDIDYLLQQSPLFLARWFLEERVLDAGVSGGYPKGLSSSPIASGGPGARETIRNEHWVIKLDDEQHPALSFNEYWSMEIARTTGLPVPVTRLSKDMRSIAIQRFDRLDDGAMLGFEDFCSLLAKSAKDKFFGSVERIAKMLKVLVPERGQREQLTQLFTQYAMVSTLRNGDAHLKNFGLLYANPEEARLSPVYDMVTMALYAPAQQNGDANDTMALTLGGSKRWLTASDIDVLAKVCDITGREKDRILRGISLAIEKVAESMVAEVPVDHDLCQAARRMLELWSHGAAAAGMACAERLPELANLIMCENDFPVPDKAEDEAAAPG